MVRFELNHSQSMKVEEALKKTDKDLEGKLNEYLKTKGSKAVAAAIIKFMPKSNRRKKHAKESNSLKRRELNLGFEVVARGGAANKKNSFGYLVFPNEGRGPHNLVEQMLFEAGLKSEEDTLFADILKIIDETL